MLIYLPILPVFDVLTPSLIHIASFVPAHRATLYDTLLWCNVIASTTITLSSPLRSICCLYAGSHAYRMYHAQGGGYSLSAWEMGQVT